MPRHEARSLNEQTRCNFDDLAIGVSKEDVGDRLDAGAASLLFGDNGGLSDRDQLWHQSSPGAAGVPEAGDFFGDALAAGDFDGDGDSDLAVGVPRETIGDIADAGAVNMLYFLD